MRTFLKSHPKIDIQLTIDYGLTDVVSERFDAGVRLGGEMDKDMIAIRIGDRTNGYCWLTGLFFSPKCSNVKNQLIDHQAINLYLPTSGTANRWRLIRGGREVRVRMEGRKLLLNTIDLIIDAAIDGHGLAYLPYDQVEPGY